MKHGLSGDLPAAQERADPVDVAPVIFADHRPQRAVRDQRGEQRQIEREAVLGLAGEVMECLDAGVLVLAENPEIDLGRLARRIAEDDDCALRSTRSIAALSERPPAASRISANRPSACSISVTISAAPSPSMIRARSGPPTIAVTRAPEREASCTARLPTPPAVPVISTRFPSNGPPWRKVRSAVSARTKAGRA